MNNPFQKVQTNHIIPKQFSYSKGKCNLNFTLRIDIKTELRDFLECLKLAQKEVEIELKDK